MPTNLKKILGKGKATQPEPQPQAHPYGQPGPQESNKTFEAMNADMDRFIGTLTQWREERASFRPRKSRLAELEKLEESRENYVATAIHEAIYFGTHRAYQVAVRFAHRVYRELSVPGEGDPECLKRFIETWQAPALNDIEARLQQLRTFRSKIAFGECAYSLMNLENLNFDRDSLKPANARLQELKACPVVRSHEDTIREAKIGHGDEVTTKADGDRMAITDLFKHWRAGDYLYILDTEVFGSQYFRELKNFLEKL